MDPLVEGVHDPSLGEFPCVRASVAAGDVLGRAEEEEPLLEDVAQSRDGVGSRKRRGVPMAVALACQAAGGDHRANASRGTASVRFATREGIRTGFTWLVWLPLDPA